MAQIYIFTNKAAFQAAQQSKFTNFEKLLFLFNQWSYFYVYLLNGWGISDRLGVADGGAA